MTDTVFKKCFNGCGNDISSLDKVADDFQSCIEANGCSDIHCGANLFNMLQTKCSNNNPFTPNNRKPILNPKPNAIINVDDSNDISKCKNCLGDDYSDSEKIFFCNMFPTDIDCDKLKSQILNLKSSLQSAIRASAETQQYDTSDNSIDNIYNKYISLVTSSSDIPRNMGTIDRIISELKNQNSPTPMPSEPTPTPTPSSLSSRKSNMNIFIGGSVALILIILILILYI